MNVVLLMGKGSIDTKYGPISEKRLYIHNLNVFAMGPLRISKGHLYKTFTRHFPLGKSPLQKVTNL